MLSEASDIVICYALLLRIKANVEKEESYTARVITPASNDHLSVLFYSFRNTNRYSCASQCPEISPCFVALNPHDLVPLKL